MSALSVKRCPNPKCMRKDRVYINGATKCELCGADLITHDISVADEASDTFNQVMSIRQDIKSLLDAK